MQSEDLLKEIQQVCREVFKDPALEITEETTAKDVESWDSISNLFFIDKVEKTFNVKLSLADILSLKKIKDLLIILQTKQQ